MCDNDPPHACPAAAGQRARQASQPCSCGRARWPAGPFQWRCCRDDVAACCHSRNPRSKAQCLCTSSLPSAAAILSVLLRPPGCRRRYIHDIQCGRSKPVVAAQAPPLYCSSGVARCGGRCLRSSSPPNQWPAAANSGSTPAQDLEHTGMVHICRASPTAHPSGERADRLAPSLAVHRTPPQPRSPILQRIIRSGQQLEITWPSARRPAGPQPEASQRPCGRERTTQSFPSPLPCTPASLTPIPPVVVPAAAAPPCNAGRTGTPAQGRAPQTLQAFRSVSPQPAAWRQNQSPQCVSLRFPRRAARRAAAWRQRPAAGRKHATARVRAGDKAGMRRGPVPEVWPGAGHPYWPAHCAFSVWAFTTRTQLVH